MTDTLLVLCTCPNREEANRLAQTLVDEQLAACVNILTSPVESIYRWQGAVERAEEVLLLIKSTADAFSRLRDRILQLHSYETPEVIAIPVADGSQSYLDWLRKQMRCE